MSAYDNLECPECSGPMKARANKSTGQKFWGCAAYPKCKGTRNSNGESASDRRVFSEDGGADIDDLPTSRAHDNDRQRWRQ